MVKSNKKFILISKHLHWISHLQKGKSKVKSSWAWLKIKVDLPLRDDISPPFPWMKNVNDPYMKNEEINGEGNQKHGSDRVHESDK